MKRKWMGIGIALLIVLACIATVASLWWKQRHPQPYCKVEQNVGFLEYKMCTNKQEYQFGEPVYITYTITNIDDTDQQYYGPIEFGNGVEPAMDICDDELYACWSNDQTLVDGDKYFTLKLRESRTLTWTLPTSSEYLSHLEDRLRTSHGGFLRIDLRGCETSLSPDVSRCWPSLIIIYGRMSQLTSRSPTP